MAILYRTYLWAMLFLLPFGFLSCSEGSQGDAVSHGAGTPTEDPVMRKVSPLLLNQIELRQKQIAQPEEARIGQMKAMGMNVDVLTSQRVFVHLSQMPTEAQARDLGTLGITLYLDSWIPPVGNAPTGFLLADMPINRLRDLASRGYVVRLETAERLSEPQGGPKVIK